MEHKKEIRIPIIYKIAIGILLVIILQGSIAYWTSSVQIKENALSDKTENIQAHMVTLQETLQFLSYSNNNSQLQKTVTSLGSHIDIKKAFLLNENNVVMASTKLELIGKHIDTIFNVGDNKEFKIRRTSLRKSLKNILWESVDGTSLYAISPILLGRSSDRLLRTDRIGTLYIHTDLNLTNHETQQSVKNLLLQEFIILILAGVILILFFNLSISQRIKSISSAATKFFNKSYSSRINVTGNDEISDLSKSFNSMAEKVEEQILEISSREKNLATTLEERNHALTELQNSQSQVHLLLDSTEEAIYGVDTNGLCSFVNKACLNLLGYEDAKELIGKDMHNLTQYQYADGSPYPLEKSHIYNSFKLGQPAHIDDEVLWRKDGSQFKAEYWAHPIIEHKICLGSVVTFLDITDRKQSEAILQRTQKMDALGKLTGGIAHDYNNMLGVILGYAELLEQSLQNEPDKADFAREITNASLRGAKLTKKLLSFSKQELSFPETTNINVLLQDQEDMLKKTLTVRIKLSFDLMHELWPVHIDINDFENAVINLSINAMHAIDEQGEINIKTMNLTLNEQDAKSLDLTAGDYVAVIFNDTGCGMDAEIKEKIFDPFYSTKGDLGTGLGLSQVYGFVKRSSGSINVKSTPKHGTQVRIYLPRERTVEKTDNIENDNLPLKETGINGNGSILIVDDEPSLLQLTSNILSSNGYDTKCAENAQIALEMLKNESFDVLLSDVVMPNMDGYQLAEIVQQKYPKIKIQLVSGFNDDRHIKMHQHELYNNLLNKPFKANELLKTIHNLLN